MQLFKSALFLVLLEPLSFGAPAREIVQMQRDIAQLQDQMRQLQKTLDDRMNALDAMMKQSLDSQTKTNSSVGALDSTLRDKLTQQLSAPISNVSTKVDQMSVEFQGVRENVTAMNETLTKVQAQIIDLSNAVKVLQAPAAPPPSGFGSPAPAAGGAAAASATPPPGLSAKQLYDSAMSDRSGGNFDLALQGFQEFLKWFGTSELAPNAQFYIGQIYYDKNDFNNAIRAFDTVLERFSENSKSSDAMYMKAMALLKSGQRTQAAQEFLEVSNRYPNSEVAGKARSQRRVLGLTTPAPPPGRPAARVKPR